MNAIVCLCHFCEAHGPCALFGTRISSEIDTFSNSSSDCNICNACTSIGCDTVITSKSPDGLVYCSRQNQNSTELNGHLKHAAFRSLSCEVSPTKEGGFFYFGDAARGHVVCYAFQMKDSLARGLKRWFSIIILMKDRMFLLNLMGFLLEHIQKIANELQDNAEVNYENDQKICSQRALRLQTGKAENSKPRSLIELTDNANIYHYLHQSFTFLLDIARRTYSETIHRSLDDSKGQTNISDMSIRQLRDLIGFDLFRIVLYCVLTGRNIVIRMKEPHCLEIVGCLSMLSPSSSFEMVHKNESKMREKLTCCTPNTEIPQSSSSSLCVVDFIEDTPVLHWSGECPQKCPTLMKHILNAVEERRMRDSVLSQHVLTLKEEWIGIASTLKAVSNSADGSNNIVKLKQVLGVKPEDEEVLNYWMKS